MEYITHSRAETVALGEKMAAVLPAGSLVAFTGGLGAGKTAFCEGLAKGLGCLDPVSSPTFAIVNYYRGPRPILICTGSPPKRIWPAPVFTIIWMRARWWPPSGAKILPICWNRSIPSGWTSAGWNKRTAAGLPLPAARICKERSE